MAYPQAGELRIPVGIQIQDIPRPLCATNPVASSASPQRTQDSGAFITVSLIGQVTCRLWPAVPGCRPAFLVGPAAASPGVSASAGVARPFGSHASPCLQRPRRLHRDPLHCLRSQKLPSLHPGKLPCHGGSLRGGRELVCEFALSRSRNLRGYT